MKQLLLIWGTTLPFGYMVVARYYPEKRLSWRDLGGMAFCVLLWPLVILSLFVRDDS